MKCDTFKKSGNFQVELEASKKKQKNFLIEHQELNR